ncbi:MAG: dihydroneopterin aldolase [Verrucomicrobiota bacterium]|nr:dihydroneopterin aldolase [Verrucomicrobiota bacterium]
MNDIITISDIEAQCRIGVPDDERKVPQRLLISLELNNDFTKASSHDDLNATIDYHAVYLLVHEICDQRERKLIETLAEDIASAVLEEFRTPCVKVEIKKFILPNTASVSAKIERFSAV